MISLFLLVCFCFNCFLEHCKNLFPTSTTAEFTQGSSLSVSAETSSTKKRQSTAELTQGTPVSVSNKSKVSSQGTTSHMSGCSKHSRASKSSKHQHPSKRKPVSQKRQSKKLQNSFDWLGKDSPLKSPPKNELSNDHCDEQMFP